MASKTIANSYNILLKEILFMQSSLKVKRDMVCIPKYVHQSYMNLNKNSKHILLFEMSKYRIAVKGCFFLISMLYTCYVTKKYLYQKEFRLLEISLGIILISPLIYNKSKHNNLNRYVYRAIVDKSDLKTIHFKTLFGKTYTTDSSALNFIDSTPISGVLCDLKNEREFVMLFKDCKFNDPNLSALVLLGYQFNIESK